jgi:CheY-like chemotaxis protein
MSKTVLIADDDSTIVKLFHLDAESKETDIVIRGSASGEETIEMLTHNKPDLLVLDIRMPKGDGFTVLEHLQKHKMDIPVLILTNYRTDEYVKKSKTYGQVKEYIVKHETRIDRIIDTVGSYLTKA